MGAAIYTGQGSTTGTGGAWIQLPNLGPLTVGVFVMSNETSNIVASVTGTGTAAYDGTGSGVILPPYAPSLFFPVANVSDVYIGNSVSSVVYSWYAY